MHSSNLMWHQSERSYRAESAPKTLAPEQDEMDAFEFFCVFPLGDKELYLGYFYVKFHEEHDALLEFVVAPIRKKLPGRKCS